MAVSNFQAVAVVVPSFNPDENLVSTIDSLTAAGFSDFVLVDDGSSSDSQKWITEAASRDGVTLIRHEKNQGKGAALKAAYSSLINRAVKPTVAVAVDSDGQHASVDVSRVVAELLSQDSPTDSIVFGVRDFAAKTVPWKSKLGNSVASGLVGLLFGKWVKDTQTGLRAFGFNRLAQQVTTPGERYEFEMNSLLQILHQSLDLVQVGITTVYLDENNSRSHFRPVADSLKVIWRIVASFFKFSMSSLSSAALDIGLFTLIVNLAFQGDPNAAQITLSVLVARIFSSLVNFFVNKKVVFGNSSSHRRTMTKYFALAVANFTASTLGVIALDHLLQGHVVWAKIITDTLLFFASYIVQRKWVFKFEQ